MDNITPDSLVGIALPTQHIGLGTVNNTLFSPSTVGLYRGMGSVELDLAYPKLQSGLNSFSKRTQTRGIRLSTRGSRQRLIGTRGNDVLDASRGAGRNFLKGNRGNDRMMAGRSDRLLGDAGNDILDARRGRGSNTLLGGAGNDTLYTKTRDTAEGGAGNDILWAGIGGNRLRGGAGADRFWIANRTLPRSINTIRDFELGIDVIGVNAVAGVTQFSDLALTQQGANTLISLQGRGVALLTGITATQLTARDFGFQEPTVSTSNISVSERDAGITTIGVEVTLSAASATSVTVDYQTVAGTATAGTDFTPTNGTLTFAPGETTKAIAIDIVGDTIDELDETFNVILSNPTNAILGNGQAVVTIIDNDTTTVNASGVQSDGSKSNSIDVRYDFNIYDITPAGDYRIDEDGNLTNDIGIFSGAIENFTGVIRENGVDPFLRFNRLQIGGEPLNTTDLFIPDALTLDLRAKFIPRGTVLTRLDGTTQVVNNNRIEYTLTNNRLRDEAGVFEWTLILEEELIEESVIDLIKAVNSIEYIIANQLLSRADRVRVSVTSKNDPQKLFVEDDVIDFQTDGNGSPAPPRVITRSTPPIPRPIPYQDTIAPTNDTIPNATDTGLSSAGFRRFQLSSRIGNESDFNSRDVDFFKVQLNANELITVSTDGFALDTVLRLFNANGTQLAFSDNNLPPGESAGIGASYIEYRANTAGTYYIGVSGRNNTAYNPLVANSGALGNAGSYDLQIFIREPNNTIATAIDTELSTPFSSFRTSSRIGDVINVSSGTDVDFYKVQLNAGEGIQIDIDTNTITPGLEVDSVLRLFNATGTQLAFSNNTAAPGESASTDSYISYTAITAGTYYIGVSGANNFFYNPLTGAGGIGDTGFYTITIQRVT